MKIVWDDNKDRINQQKHQISFEMAQHVFDDPLHVSRQDRFENGELRWHTIGLVGGIALLLVVHYHHRCGRPSGHPHHFGAKSR